MRGIGKKRSCGEERQQCPSHAALALAAATTTVPPQGGRKEGTILYHILHYFT
jgi:hypothetical protein